MILVAFGTLGVCSAMLDVGQGQAHQDEIAMLLALCARSDTHAFRRLYDLESRSLYGLALRITRDSAMANDALHDAMLQIWHNAARFNPAHASGRTWMLSLVRYRAIDIARRAGREMLTSDPPDMPDPQPDPYEHLAATYEDRTLQYCLGTIDERPRRLLVLAFIEGLTHAQVAEQVGEPLGTVKSSIRRTLTALRACMGDAK